MEKEIKNIKNALMASTFIKNNGEVLRTLNILGYQFHKLIGIESVLSQRGISESEFIEAIHFLTEESYITLRNISTKEAVIISDTDYRDIEAKLSGKGLRLLNGGISDNMVEV